MIKEDIKYSIIIETDQYTGNFERELTAYCTGEIGDCEVGELEANEFIADFSDESPFSFDFDRVGDEYGCFRPVKMELNDDCQYNSLRIFIDQSGLPSVEELKLIYDRAVKYSERLEPATKIIAIKLCKTVTTDIIETIDVG